MLELTQIVIPTSVNLGLILGSLLVLAIMVICEVYNE